MNSIKTPKERLLETVIRSVRIVIAEDELVQGRNFECAREPKMIFYNRARQTGCSVEQTLNVLAGTNTRVRCENRRRNLFGQLRCERGIFEVIRLQGFVGAGEHE